MLCHFKQRSTPKEVVKLKLRKGVGGSAEFSWSLSDRSLHPQSWQGPLCHRRCKVKHSCLGRGGLLLDLLCYWKALFHKAISSAQWLYRPTPCDQPSPVFCDAPFVCARRSPLLLATALSPPINSLQGFRTQFKWSA